MLSRTPRAQLCTTYKAVFLQKRVLVNQKTQERAVPTPKASRPHLGLPALWSRSQVWIGVIIVYSRVILNEVLNEGQESCACDSPTLSQLSAEAPSGAIQSTQFAQLVCRLGSVTSWSYGSPYIRRNLVDKTGTPIFTHLKKSGGDLSYMLCQPTT